MGLFRFRRSFRLLPSVRLNLGKRSASVSVGVRGAHVTLGGPQGTRTTVGLPGSGLSYTEVHKDLAMPQAPQEATPALVQQGNAGRLWLWILMLLAVAFLAWRLTR